MRHILTDEAMSSVRLVVNPEKMVIAEARRTYTYLALFGYRVDAVVVNRIMPDDVTDPYFGKWKDIQAEHLATVHESFEPVPILDGAAVRPRDGRRRAARGDGRRGLRRARGHRRAVPSTTRSGSSKRGGGYVLPMQLPFVAGGDLDVHRRGEELVVRVGPYKRNLMLPQTLQRLAVRGASLVDEHLEIAFERSPEGEPGEGAER